MNAELRKFPLFTPGRLHDRHESVNLSEVRTREWILLQRSITPDQGLSLFDRFQQHADARNQVQHVEKLYDVIPGKRLVRLLSSFAGNPRIIQMSACDLRRQEVSITYPMHFRSSLGRAIEDGPWDRSMTPKIARQLTEAVLLLHNKGIMHRDVKPDNILLSDRGDGVLCDFERATEHGDHLVKEFGNGSVVDTSMYLAPEMCTSPPDYGLPVDVWAIGCTILQLLGYTPWDPSLPPDQLKAKIAKCRGGRKPDGCPKRHECSVELWEVLTGAFEPDPRRRATCETLLTLPYLRDG